VTKLPIDSRDVRGVAGPEYKVGPYCCVPECRRVTEHAHHIWRRSELGGPFSWVELPDGHVVGNLAGMCPPHHEAVTGRIGGHKAAIRMTDDHVFWWCRYINEQYEFVAPIDPQPPTHEAHVASPADVESENSCPTCGRPRARRRKTASSSKRARKTWPVRVPADAEENGAEVLDSLTEDLAPLLGVDPDDNGTYTSGRYYVLVPALYFAQTKRDEFVKSILGVD
jgi:hypothetical protein